MLRADSLSQPGAGWGGAKNYQMKQVCLQSKTSSGRSDHSLNNDWFLVRHSRRRKSTRRPELRQTPYEWL